MTKEQFAAVLNGREIGNEITSAEENTAVKNGLVVIFGASDDLMEMRGAICDEYGFYEGGTVMVDATGILSQWEDFFSQNSKEREFAEYFARKPHAKEITANWDSEGYSWTYTTQIPHATFDIMEDGEKYCRGIVFSIADLLP